MMYGLAIVKKQVDGMFSKLELIRLMAVNHFKFKIMASAPRILWYTCCDDDRACTNMMIDIRNSRPGP